METRGLDRVLEILHEEMVGNPRAMLGSKIDTWTSKREKELPDLGERRVTSASAKLQGSHGRTREAGRASKSQNRLLNPISLRYPHIAVDGCSNSRE